MNVSNADPIVSYIETEWRVKTEEKDDKSRAKLLRLLVNHIKSKEGIPPDFQKGVRAKVQELLDNLESMEIDVAAQCVSAIDHANARLTTIGGFGEGLRAQLSSKEKRDIKRAFQPLRLTAASPQSEDLATDRGPDDLRA